MLASGDPIATGLQARYKVTMPNLRVGDRDLAALLDFLGAGAGVAQAPVGARSSAVRDGDFVLAADPGVVMVIAGAEAKFTVTFKSVGGFTGWVQTQTLGVESAQGAVGTWSSPSVKVSSEGATKATFTILTLLDTPPGEYPIVFQGLNGSVAHRTAAVTLHVTGPPKNAITAVLHPDSPTVGATRYTIAGNATAGGWVKDLSTFPDGSVHSVSSKANGVGAYTIGPFVPRQRGTYHDVLIDTETGGRTELVYHAPMRD